VVSMLKGRGITLNIKDIFQYHTIEQLALQAIPAVNSMIDKMGKEALEQKEKLSAEGKNIEEGMFL
jgi:hypothetical protein